jgi:diamine N-acetyltransferase
MDTLKGTHINLRALEPEDLSFLYQLENDEAIWEVSHTQSPYSSYILKEYIVNAHKDIYEVKQLRLAIEVKAGKLLGLIDLFDFDPKNKRAGVGIVIANKEDRNKGLGKEALELIIKYSFTHLNLHQLYCNITEDNQASIILFESLGFTRIGLKKDWNFHEGVFKNEIAYQLIK